MGLQVAIDFWDLRLEGVYVKMPPFGGGRFKGAVLQLWEESSAGFRILTEDFALKQGMSREYSAGILQEIGRKSQAVPGNSVAEKDFIMLRGKKNYSLDTFWRALNKS